MAEKFEYRYEKLEDAAGLAFTMMVKTGARYKRNTVSTVARYAALVVRQGGDRDAVISAMKKAFTRRQIAQPVDGLECELFVLRKPKARAPATINQGQALQTAR